MRSPSLSRASPTHAGTASRGFVNRCLPPVCLLLLWTQVAAGQELAPGERVRVTTTGPEPVVAVGQLVRLDGDSLGVETAGGRLTMSARDVIVERSEGYHRHTLAGAGIGALLVGGVLAFDYRRSPGQCEGSGNYGQLCAIVLALGVVAGAGLGALVGTAIRHEDWLSISLDPGPWSSPHGAESWAARAAVPAPAGRLGAGRPGTWSWSVRFPVR